MSFKPVLQALLVAEQIYTDSKTNKKILAGIFHNIGIRNRENVDKLIQSQHGADVVPGGMGVGAPTPSVYISLTDVYQQQAFVLRYVNLESDEVIFQAEFNIDSPDPLMTHEIDLGTPPLPLAPSHYAMEVMWNDALLGSFRITVHEIPVEGMEDSDDSN